MEDLIVGKGVFPGTLPGGDDRMLSPYRGG
jgi:hypothetical protein